MADQLKSSQGNRIHSQSKSHPALSSIKINTTSAVWPPLQPPKLPRRRHPTFTAGAPSEPPSPQDDSDPGSGSSFEREFLSRPGSSDSDSDSSDDDDSAHVDHHNTIPTSATHGSATHLSPSGSRSYAHLTPSSSRPSLLASSSRSKSALGPRAFAPPFYNRPPTPLPPSPSLTSLLRPRPFAAFSSSRPTTPDSSDTEGAFSTHAGTRGPGAPSALVGSGLSSASLRTTTSSTIAHSALTATTVPRASPKVPTYEYYGFVLYLGSSVAFFLYLLWSYLPTPFLHQLGIYYYPDRWWSLAVPGWLVVCLCYVYVALACWNTGYLTLGLGSLECLVDEKGRIAVVDEEGRVVREDRWVGGGKKGEKEGRGKARGKGRTRQVVDLGYGRKGIGGSGEMRELDWRSMWGEGTDAVMDVPIGGVCEVLYGVGREGDDRDENEMM